MNRKKIKIFFFLVILFSSIIYILSFSFKKKNLQTEIIPDIQTNQNSNLLSELNFSSDDGKGNIYTLKALKGEIDFENNNIIFLEKINAIIELKNSEKIYISSDFGKYNIENSDTIFSKNIIISYLENKVESDYLEFSIEKNALIISKDVSLSNGDYTVNADVVEMNLDTKKVEIFMYEGLKKVKIKSIK